jgi:hypothetical protein
MHLLDMVEERLLVEFLGVFWGTIWRVPLGIAFVEHYAFRLRALRCRCEFRKWETRKRVLGTNACSDALGKNCAWKLPRAKLRRAAVRSKPENSAHICIAVVLLHIPPRHSWECVGRYWLGMFQMLKRMETTTTKRAYSTHHPTQDKSTCKTRQEHV